MKIAISGGSGFVGRTITRQLQNKHSIVWLSSSQPTLTKEFKQVTVKKVCYQSSESLSVALENCDVVINLIGILHKKATASFDNVHHQLPQQILSVCANLKIRRYLHMSALGAASNGPSQYLKSKYLGEQKAFAIAKKHKIFMLSFRPSIIFGKEDNFFNQFARILKFSLIFPIVCPYAKFQPVSVNDVAKALAWGLSNGLDGSTYELVGKDVITMRQAISMVCDYYDWQRLLIPIPDAIAKLQGKILNYIPGAPFTYDNYLSLQKPNISNRWDWDEIGIKPEKICIYPLNT